MKITLVSGSPKLNSSASRTILTALEKYLADSSDGKNIITHRHISAPDTAQTINDSDAVVLAFPLYVDGVPSHLLAAMEQLEREKCLNAGTRVYVVVNCGFYEGIQCEPAVRIAKNWCRRCGAQWEGAIGFGGGGGFDMMDAIPMGVGPKKSLGGALRSLADCVSEGTEYGERYLSIDFPGFMYRIGAHSYWRMQARANGLEKSELARRPGVQ